MVNGWGQRKFIPQQDLRHSGDKNCQYLKSDTLFFRVDRFEPKLDQIQHHSTYLGSTALYYVCVPL